MSFLGGIGGGGNRIPKAPTADNRPLQNGKVPGSLIRSATWGRTEARIGDTMTLTVVLNKLPLSRTAIIEILYNSQTAHPRAIGKPLILPSTSAQINGHWQVKAEPEVDLGTGYLTFRVTLDNQVQTSNKLTITDDRVSRLVRRISTDGFDR